MDKRLNTSWWVLRVGMGTVAAVAGFDKFFNLLADWPRYVSPFFAEMMPFGTQRFMYIAGVVEMAVGFAILTRWTRVGAYLLMAWMICIAVNLVTSGHYFDIAARDVLISLSAFTLAKLSEVREGIAVQVERPERTPRHRVAPAFR